MERKIGPGIRAIKSPHHRCVNDRDYGGKIRHRAVGTHRIEVISAKGSCDLLLMTVHNGTDEAKEISEQ
ncbi:MAG: hypothetical protein ACREFO_17355 [Acetobacteraceae bacterium]